MCPQSLWSCLVTLFICWLVWVFWIFWGFSVLLFCLFVCQLQQDFASKSQSKPGFDWILLTSSQEKASPSSLTAIFVLWLSSACHTWYVWHTGFPLFPPTFDFPSETWSELGNTISGRNIQEIEAINRTDWLSLPEVWSAVVETKHWWPRKIWS